VKAISISGSVTFFPRKSKPYLSVKHPIFQVRLEPYIRPAQLIPQYRDHIVGHDRTAEVALEGQQQVLRATFPGIRNCVRELLGVLADALARKFHETHDMAVKDELERLLKEYGKLREPWVFSPK
jgi:hypothetical protein